MLLADFSIAFDAINFKKLHMLNFSHDYLL